MENFTGDMPPSTLGFTGDSALPTHVGIMFRARPPLEMAQIERKTKFGSYSCILPKGKDLSYYFKETTEQLKKEEEKLAPEIPRSIKHFILTSKLRREYNPDEDPKATKDPRKTMFVRNLAYSTTERKLKEAFRRYGKITHCRIVTNLAGKSKGYGFIEFKHRSDMKEAIDYGYGTKIDGRRIKVEQEKARNDKYWYPRRLDGGKGGRKSKKHDKQIKTYIKQFKDGVFDGKVNLIQLTGEAFKEFNEANDKRIDKDLAEAGLDTLSSLSKSKQPEAKIRDLSTELDESHVRYKEIHKYYLKKREQKAKLSFYDKLMIIVEGRNSKFMPKPSTYSSTCRERLSNI
ncbi:unnamed protein product [Moneuplotes crassus]|uniref:RRM domain-containing protein n=1 Tax=Euplotes crassus TaxID=5936 RepID=A0AAD2CY14_EUPCR|nr:unnamed protein product [Moneuplotes crassus]